MGRSHLNCCQCLLQCAFYFFRWANSECILLVPAHVPFSSLLLSHEYIFFQVGNFAFWLDSLLVAVMAGYGAQAFHQVSAMWSFLAYVLTRPWSNDDRHLITPYLHVYMIFGFVMIPTFFCQLPTTLR